MLTVLPRSCAIAARASLPGSVIGVPESLCLLTVHAHPDDEASKGAGTVARYHAEGVHTVLVCCTGGEEGEILNPALDTPEVRARIAEVRKRGAGPGRRGHRLRRGGHARLPRLGHGRVGGQRQPATASPRRPSTRRSGAWWRSSGAPGPRSWSSTATTSRLPPPRPPAGPRGRAGRLPGRRRPDPVSRGRCGLPAGQALLHDVLRQPGSGRSTRSSRSSGSSRHSTRSGGRGGKDAPTRSTPRRSTSPGTPTCAARRCWPTPPRSTPSRRSGSGCHPR